MDGRKRNSIVRPDILEGYRHLLYVSRTRQHHRHDQMSVTLCISLQHDNESNSTSVWLKLGEPVNGSRVSTVYEQQEAQKHQSCSPDPQEES